MSASTDTLWQRQESRSSDGSSAWVGVLLFIGSSVVSVKTLAWLATFAAGYVMQ